MTATLIVHIVAGSLGIASGYTALAAAKGATLHRRSGRLFVGAMLVMGTLGAILAAFAGTWEVINIPAGVLTVYMVLTAFLAVRPPSPGRRWIDIAAMLVALGVGLMCLTFGIEAIANGGARDGIPAFPFFLFGVSGTLAAVQDIRTIRSGAPLVGTPRLRRHLWRMSFALFVAAMSFFIGQADVFPKPYRIMPLLAVPALAPLMAMGYWLWRLRGRRTRRAVVLPSGLEVG